MSDPSQTTRDNEHIQVLVVIHYVVAALASLGICFLGGHYLLLRFVFATAVHKDPNVPAEMLMFVPWIWVFYAAAGLMILAGVILNFLSARFMSQRRNRVFSMVVAGLNCTNIPVGAILGVFTLIVLSRESVRQSYAANDGAGVPRQDGGA